MRLVEQWRAIREELPEDWAEARLDLSVKRERELPRAAALLGPATPGRTAGGLRLSVLRAGGGVGPDQATKLFGLLDDERIGGTLALDRVGERPEPAPAPAAAARHASVATAWRRALAGLPADWSDLQCELQLTSTDHLDRAALLTAPLNPVRVPGRSAFRFRLARRFGYGGSPEMAERCFERLDEDRIPGRIEVLRVLSDTHNVATQGPVWRVGGKAV